MPYGLFCKAICSVSTPSSSKTSESSAVSLYSFYKCFYSSSSKTAWSKAIRIFQLSKSCDLTPLDYFLWGYVKSLVYADKPQTLDHLEDIIRRAIAGIRPQMLEKVIENWTSRLDYIRASRGSPMPEIIFKM
ncbi:hypothetical protein TNCV_1211961 [Trichonephila clavipes]|nr:hypothetical protein TNCV_1211961 [Trichonephila clavipes]